MFAIRHLLGGAEETQKNFTTAGNRKQNPVQQSVRMGTEHRCMTFDL